jgi:hypothetical protein
MYKLLIRADVDGKGLNEKYGRIRCFLTKGIIKFQPFPSDPRISETFTTFSNLWRSWCSMFTFLHSLPLWTWLIPHMIQTTYTCTAPLQSEETWPSNQIHSPRNGFARPQDSTRINHWNTLIQSNNYLEVTAYSFHTYNYQGKRSLQTKT